jgi:hypothetical protein
MYNTNTILQMTHNNYLCYCVAFFIYLRYQAEAGYFGSTSATVEFIASILLLIHVMWVPVLILVKSYKYGWFSLKSKIQHRQEVIAKYREDLKSKAKLASLSKSAT